jgi:hypothetical protein
VFSTDLLILSCQHLDARRDWWIKTFDCSQAKLPDWDNPLPSDIAMRLPRSPEPTILLCSQAELDQSGLDKTAERPLIFCSNLEKARRHLEAKGITAGPVQELSGMRFFEIFDPEGNSIEICEEV